MKQSRTVPGRAVAYRVTGNPYGPTLVFSNSLGAVQDSWRPQVEELGSRYRCVTYDHRGHGGSTGAPRPFTVADLVEDARSVIETAGGGPVAFCGVSLGGLVGVLLAAAHPSLVGSLTVINAPTHQENPAFWRARAEAVRAGGMAVAADGVDRRWFGEPFRRASGAVVADCVDQLRALDPEGYAAACEALADADARDVAPRVTCPTTVVVGTADGAVPTAHSHAYARLIPGAHLVELPGTGHMAAMEQADRVCTLIDRSTAGTEV